MSIFRSRSRPREAEKDEEDKVKDQLLQVTEELRAALLRYPANGLQPQPMIEERRRDRA